VAGEKAMSDKDTGGPAFPRPFSIDDVDPDVSYPAHIGMTLRDYFAAKAMQADMTDGVHESDFAWSAARAYKMADAMLEARKQ
jgi:hypothetical protein